MNKRGAGRPKETPTHHLRIPRNVLTEVRALQRVGKGRHTMEDADVLEAFAKRARRTAK